MRRVLGKSYFQRAHPTEHLSNGSPFVGPESYGRGVALRGRRRFRLLR
jgi:hypothetical protein